MTTVEEQKMVTIMVDNKPVEVTAPDEEEHYLEKLVFGDTDGFVNNLRNVDNLYIDDDNDDEYENNNSNPFNYSDSEVDEFLDTMANKQEYGFDEIDNNSDDDNSHDDDDEINKLNDDELFFNDSEADSDAVMDIDNDETNNLNDSESENSSDDNVWIDSDDERLVIDANSFDRLRKLRESEDERFIPGLEYVSRLKKQYRSTFKVPEWAKHEYIDDKEEGEGEGEGEGEENNENGKITGQIFDKVGSSKRSVITASSNPLMDFLAQNQTYNITNDNSKLLNPEHLNIDRLIDANISKPSRSSIQTLSFHPTQPLLLTGGFDRTLRIYHIDGKNNNLISSLHLRQSPVQTCGFLKDKETGLTTILAGGRRKYMFKWSIDLGVIEKITRMYGNENKQRSFEHFKISKDCKYIALAGNSGWVNILSVATSQWVHGFKIEGTLVDFEFSNDRLLIINQAGEIWEFSIETYNIINKWTDVTGIGITRIRISPNGRFLAIGSNTGFVNVYDRLKDNRLMKSISNLTTTISSLEFSYDSQVLCIASRDARDALKLVHLPSCNVFKNWPTNVTPLGKVTAVAFAPTGGFLATGNEQGRVRLWRLLDL
jgi:U3 small nucleolar RNA-associated protein 18